MAFQPGQSGNAGGRSKEKIWRNAIERAVQRATTGRIDYAKLDELADKLLSLAADGDMQALKEIGDRLDGKPAQAITGPDGERLIDAIVVTIVNPPVVP